jgi:hypothetical protein
VRVELQPLEAARVARAAQFLEPGEGLELDVHVRDVDRVAGLAGEVEAAGAVEGDARQLARARGQRDRLLEGVVLRVVLV